MGADIDIEQYQPSDTVTLVVPGKNADNPDEQTKFFDFGEARTHLTRLIGDWKEEINDTYQRRKQRKIELNVETMRQKGEIDEDETLIPIRTIDTNIAREQPPYIQYLKNSRRLAIFKCLDDPNQFTDKIDLDFTRVATYPGWESAYFKCLDGSMAHGTDAVEVVYDERMQMYGNFSLEHIAHDKLYYPRSAQDLQACSRIARAYDVTLMQLRQWVNKFGFNQAQVDIIASSKRETTKEAETIRIYKLFFKVWDPQLKKNVVHVTWFSLTDGTSDWLKLPAPHYVGIGTEQSPEPLELYPIFMMHYKLSEEQRLIDSKGRGFLDGYKQEAQTALWSSLVNGCNRASGIYGSPAQEDGTGSSLKEIEDVKMTPGRYMNKPVQFWNLPYPDPMLFKLLQTMDVQNSDETNQVNFAAMNREDSRKTAKEIGSAEKQQTQINSVQLTNYSTFIRNVVAFCWRIVQSQALQNKIKFLLIQQQVPIPQQVNPVMGGVMPMAPQQPQMQTVWVNDIATIQKIYDIRAAGDVDVIQSDEMQAKMQQDWPIISQTALKDQFMLDYIKIRYPDRGEMYAQIVEQQGGQLDQLKGLVGQLSTMMEGLLKDHPEDIDRLPQQMRQDMAQTMQAAKAVVGQPPTQ